MRMEYALGFSKLTPPIKVKFLYVRMGSSGYRRVFLAVAEKSSREFSRRILIRGSAGCGVIVILLLVLIILSRLDDWSERKEAHQCPVPREAEELELKIARCYRVTRPVCCCCRIRLSSTQRSERTALSESSRSIAEKGPLLRVRKQPVTRRNSENCKELSG
jgi:hypothetical protein